MSLDYSSLDGYGGCFTGSEVGTIEQPEVILGDYSDLDYGTVRPRRIEDISDPVIEDFNSENMDAFTRLDYHVFDEENGILYVDDHNHALTGWLAASNEGDLEGETVLFHVDGHYDDSIPEPFYPPEDVSEAEALVGDMVAIDEFIYPAEQWGLVDRTINWGVEENVRELLIRDFRADSLIMDLDLDVFRDIEDPEPVYELIGDLISEADFTTVATSPGYIEQDEALHHLEKIMEN